MELTQNTPTRGDCTAGYKVSLSKEYTVSELIDKILTRKEWGYIGIYKEGLAWFSPGDPYCEYRQDKLLSTMPSEILNKKVIEVNAHGGYSNMDYKIKI